jgi:hypothetical protein
MALVAITANTLAAVGLVIDTIYYMGEIENYLEAHLINEGRSCPRLRCKYITECWDDDGNRWACKIVDISERGLGIVISATLHIGNILNITDPKTRARVVWIDKGRIGLRVCN